MCGDIDSKVTYLASNFIEAFRLAVPYQLGDARALAVRVCKGSSRRLCVCVVIVCERSKSHTHRHLNLR